jgi:hypothetical protein
MKTSKTEIKKLLKDGWEITDPSCNQMRKQIKEDEIYSFREDRIINPKTKEKIIFKKTLYYDNYTYSYLMKCCEAFGYETTVIDKWITEGEEIPLMLECVFELL